MFAHGYMPPGNQGFSKLQAWSPTNIFGTTNVVANADRSAIQSVVDNPKFGSGYLTFKRKFSPPLL